MKRFFGMMPSDEIEMTKHFKDERNRDITIDAGPHGWTIIYSDGSTNYKDIEDTTENNYVDAFKSLISKFPEIKEVSNVSCNAYIGEC